MKELLKSARFQGILVIAVLQVLMVFNIISSGQLEALVQIVQTVIAGAVVVRTVDRMGEKIGGV